MPNERTPPSPHVHQGSLDTASTPESFAEREIELGTGTLTCTDHGTLASSRKIYDLAKEKGLTSIIGLEAYLRDENCPILTKQGLDPKTYAKYFHVTMHFLDQKAFEKASVLISKAPYEKHGEEYKPLFTWENLEELGAENVTMGSSCLIGAVQRHLLDHGSVENAEAYYQKLRSCVKPNNFLVEVFPHVCDRNWVSGVFIELQNGDKIETKQFRLSKNLKTNIGEIYAEDLAKEFNKKGNKHTNLLGIRNYRSWDEVPDLRIVNVKKVEDFLLNECNPQFPDGDVQKGGNLFVLEMAKKYDDLIICSDDSHFATPDYKPVQDVRLMAGGGAWRFSNSYHRQSGEELWDYFNNKLGVERKEYDSWVQNAFDWASKFKDFKFDYKPELPSKFFPSNTLSYLKELINKHGRMNWSDKQYTERLKAEIELFHNNGVVDMLPYFFSYENICYHCQEKQSFNGYSRGSAGGVLISYLLGITHSDPIKLGLSLERFLTIDRIKAGNFPDIDLDLSNREILTGGEIEKFEVELENGEVKVFEKGLIINTNEGPRRIEDALIDGLEIL